MIETAALRPVARVCVHAFVRNKNFSGYIRGLYTSMPSYIYIYFYLYMYKFVFVLGGAIPFAGHVKRKDKSERSKEGEDSKTILEGS